jgi:hypothetical protein
MANFREISTDSNEGTNSSEASSGGMVFPSVLNTLNSIRPVINILCVGGDNDGKSVTLPCPTGFNVTDGASYNDAELGFLGKVALDQITSLQQSGASFDNRDQGLSAVKDDLMSIAPGSGNFVKSLKEFSAAASDVGGIGKGVAIGVGAILNKNVTTEFTGVGTRSFSFQYKLVPSSQDEGAEIGNITKFLRQGIYPSKSAAGSVLKYPPRWKLSFLTKINGEPLPTIPAIAECYMESFATTYNGSNSFHHDGVPVDTDISLSFKEFRALTLEDINDLDAGGSVGL